MMKTLLGLGVISVITALYLDSLVSDSVVEHRLRVTIATAIITPVYYLASALERYFDIGHYTLLRAPPVFTVSMDDGKVKAYNDVADGVPVRVYTPYTCSEACSGIVYFHGGGFCALSVDSSHKTMLDLANTANSIVISVEYRLAPEHPFPAAITDCMAVTKHVADNPSRYGIAPGKLYIGGDSAGGNLAAVIDAEKTEFKLKGVILIYPIAQLASFGLHSHKTQSYGVLQNYVLAQFLSSYFNLSTCKHYSAVANGQHVCKDSETTKIFNKYLGIEVTEDCNPELAKKLSVIFDERSSPLFRKNLSGLSPTVVLLAEADILRDEGLLYYERLKMAGVKALKKVYSSATHGFFSFLGPLVYPTQYKAIMEDIAHYIQYGEIEST